MKQAYIFLKLNPNGCDPLRTQFETFLKKQGLAAIEKINTEASVVCMR
jgi:hypothetical protein